MARFCCLFKFCFVDFGFFGFGFGGVVFCIGCLCFCLDCFGWVLLGGGFWLVVWVVRFVYIVFFVALECFVRVNGWWV